MELQKSILPFPGFDLAQEIVHKVLQNLSNKTFSTTDQQ